MESSLGLAFMMSVFAFQGGLLVFFLYKCIGWFITDYRKWKQSPGLPPVAWPMKSPKESSPLDQPKEEA